ncbi:MAG: aldo/keto reductase [Oscillospiraceae bacterium]|nr:aldo/keto reductase [Oscillospiraceae bacterium]
MEIQSIKEQLMIGTWAWGTGSNGSAMIFGNKQNPEVLRASFAKAVDCGFRNWDTAAVYGMGTCETLLGELIEQRDDIFLSTKFMPDKKFKSGALLQSFEESMTRLKRTSADLFWIHVPNHLSENLKEAIPLIQDGRIRSIGLSNVSLSHIKHAQVLLAKEGLTLGAVQNHFSLLRNDQQQIIDYCNARGIRYYAYMVLEQGALSGRYDADHHFPTFSMRNMAFPKRKFRKIEGLLKKLHSLADKYQVDPSQIPILWVIGKGAVPIVGITNPSHAEALAATMQVTLTTEEMNLLEQAAAATGLRQQGIWEPQ